MDQPSNNVHSAVRRFILDTFVFEPDHKARVTDDIPLIDEGILDSFGVHEVLLFLEHELFFGEGKIHGFLLNNMARTPFPAGAGRSVRVFRSWLRRKTLSECTGPNVHGVSVP